MCCFASLVLHVLALSREHDFGCVEGALRLDVMPGISGTIAAIVLYPVKLLLSQGEAAFTRACTLVYIIRLIVSNVTVAVLSSLGTCDLIYRSTVTFFNQRWWLLC